MAIVRAFRHPAPPPRRPANWLAIAAQCRRLSDRGHYAAVLVANGDDAVGKLWRGHAMQVRFDGFAWRHAAVRHLARAR